MVRFYDFIKKRGQKRNLQNMANINNLNSNPSGYCVVCSTKTNLVCHRCGDFYCSRQCQLKDWQSHRYICFSVPALVRPMECSAFSHINSTQALISSEAPIPSSIVTANALSAQKSKVVQHATNGTASGCDKSKNKAVNNTSAAQPPVPIVVNNDNNNSSSNNITLKKIPFEHIYPSHVTMPPNNSIVYVTGFRSANRCFIRDASETAEKAHFEICQKVNLLGKNQPKLQNLNTAGHALAKCNGLFQRVKIINKTSKSPARLHFLDLGMLIAKDIAEMREISSELLELPCHNLEVQINGVPNYALTSGIHNFLNRFNGKKFIITNINGFHVELLHVETHKSINEQILEFCSSMQVYYQSKKPKQHSKNCLDPKRAADAAEKSVDQCLNSAKLKPEIINLQLMLKKDHTTVANHEQIAKTENIPDVSEIKLDKESSSSETKPEGSVSFNNSIKIKSEIANLQLMLKKDHTTVANHEQIAKTENIPDASEIKLDKESTSSETKRKASVLFNNSIKIKPEIANLPLMLKKDHTTVANHEQIAKTENIPDASEIKLDKEPTSSETKPKASVPFNTDALEMMPTSVLASAAATKVQTKTKESPAQAFVSIPIVSPIIVSESKNPTNNTTKTNVEPVLIPPFELKRLTSQANEGLDIFIVDNANVSRGIFGGFDSNNARDFSDLHSRLYEFKDSLPYRPMINEYVIAKFEDVWYRARVIRIKQNQLDCTYNVMLLEFAKVASVTVQDIRRYPADLEVPCFTSVCLIEDFPHRTTTAQINFLEEKLQLNSIFHIDSVNYSPHMDMAVVRCKSLIDELDQIM